MQKDSANCSSKSHLSKYWIYYLLIVIEAIMIVLYSIFVQFGVISQPNFAQLYDKMSEKHFTKYWPIFQDINVMVFVGFGFIVAHLNKYSWSGIAISFGLAAWTIQMLFLCYGWWLSVLLAYWSTKISLNLINMISAEFTATAVLVALGAVLGKLNVAQYFVMATMITLTQPLVSIVSDSIFMANDLGGGMNVFFYGSVFGLFVSLVVTKNESKITKNYISRNSGLFALLGTLFLWVFWPSWNGAFFSGNLRLRAHINTILSLTGSCVLSFFSSVFLSNGKFNMKHILYGSISGGIIMGSISDAIILPWVSFLIGCGSGAITVLGLNYATPRLNNTRFQDSIGVLFIYGIPGFLSGILSAIFAGTASVWDYGYDIYNVYLLWDIRPRQISAGFQLAVLAIDLGLAIVAGSFTGAILNCSCFQNVHNLFDDLEIFHSVLDSKDVESQERKIIEMQHFKVISRTAKDEDNQKNKKPETEVLDEPKKEIKEWKEEAPQIKQIEIHVNAMD